MAEVPLSCDPKASVVSPKELGVEKVIDMQSQAEAATPVKIAYKSPQLITYGRVGALTQAGSSNGQEAQDMTTGVYSGPKTMV